MVRTLKLFARRIARTVTLMSQAPPKAMVETEDGLLIFLDRPAAETVRRHIGHKRNGNFSPLDCQEGQALLAAVESFGISVGDIFEVRYRGLVVLFLVEDDGLAFLV